MSKLGLLAAVTTALTLTAGLASAADVAMEKCQVMNNAGQGLVKAMKGDCKTTSHSCAGQNQAGDPLSWVNVPAGQCAKINAGDFMGVDQAIQDKVVMANMK